MYFVVNNLHSAVMSHYIPYGGLTWLNDWTFLDIRREPDNSRVSYILKVDLEHPIELNDAHEDLPLASEHTVPPSGQSKLPKLLATFITQKNYVICYTNLKQYIDLGSEVVKAYKVLKFNENCWLKPYIYLNTELRKNSENEFAKNFYKLMNYSVYGKMIENVRKRQKVKVDTKYEGQ